MPSLQNTRVARRSDRVIQRRGEVCRATANRVRVVEGVECFETELSVETLCEFYVFEQRKVRATETWATNGAGSFGGFGRLRCAGCSEGRRIEPTAEGMRSAGVGITDLIRTAAYG